MEKLMAKLSKKAIEAKVGKIANKAVVGYVIPMMSIPKIYEAGVAAVS
jgi:methylmalonyl-CoA mutase cobalamin-binding subunit